MSSILTNTTSSLFGSRPLPETAKKFLSGRPSLHDVLVVAPEWEPAFKTVHSALLQKEQYIDTLRSSLRTLRATSEECKNELTERQNVSRINSYAQAALFDEINEQQPVVRKLNRQVNTLATSCRRLIPSTNNATTTTTTTTMTGSLVMIPQPDNVRFIEDLKRRTYELQVRAEVVLESIEFAKGTLNEEKELNLDNEIKNLLTLLLEQYKQLKLRHLGLQEELKFYTQSSHKLTSSDLTDGNEI